MLSEHLQMTNNQPFGVKKMTNIISRLVFCGAASADATCQNCFLTSLSLSWALSWRSVGSVNLILSSANPRLHWKKNVFNVVSAAFIKEGNSCDLFRFVCSMRKEEKIRLADNSVACEAIWFDKWFSGS